MIQRFDLCILIYPKRAKVHYAHIKVQLFSKDCKKWEAILLKIKLLKSNGKAAEYDEI